MGLIDDFVLNSQVNWEPMKMFQDACYVLTFSLQCDQPGCSILYPLHRSDGCLGKTLQETITVYSQAEMCM